MRVNILPDPACLAINNDLIPDKINSDQKPILNKLTKKSMTHQNSNSPFSKYRWLWIALAIVLSAALILGIQWATYARPPLDEALASLESDSMVRIETEPWLIFTPLETEPSAGLIFYPGGRIDPRGYASLLRPIAEEGYLVVVPSMPINMAIFNAGAAEGIIEHFTGIESWAIAGHSVGGVAAAIFTSRNPDQIDGLAIWASYPANSSDLSQAQIPVYSIFGELDPRANLSSVQERADLLPPDTVYINIPGGGHHQFGSYLIKPEEQQATISPEQQQGQIIQATLEMLALVSQ